jgi:LPS-assembly lipoprotein
MWSSDRRTLLCFAAALPAVLAGGCGFQPMYGEGAPSRAIQGRVDVMTAPDGNGYIMRDRLVQLLGSPVAASHVLEVDIDIATQGVALTESDITTRYAIVGTAQFRLVPLAGGPPVLVDEVRAIAGYSAPESEISAAFASQAAERNTRERVVLTLAGRIADRLALTAGEWAA